MEGSGEERTRKEGREERRKEGIVLREQAKVNPKRHAQVGRSSYIRWDFQEPE